MLADSLLHWIEQTSFSTTIRQSSWAVMALEAVHLLGLALLGGAAVIATLRNANIPITTFVRELRPVAATGFALMAVSGTLIALSMPFKYYNNTAFQWKMVLLLCSVIVTLQLARRPSRVLALLSLVLWLGVGVSGRLIGFL
jgi:hypothetical protein